MVVSQFTMRLLNAGTKASPVPILTMDSENSLDGELEAKDRKDVDGNLSDDERVARNKPNQTHLTGGSSPRSPQESPQYSPPQRSSLGSRSNSASRRSPSSSPVNHTRHSRSGSSARRSPSGSPPRHSPPGSPSRHSPFGSPARRSPSGSPPRRSPSGSPSRRSPSGSPARRSPSGSPARRSPSGSPARRSPSGTPPRRSPSGTPPRRSPSGSPPRHSSSGRLTRRSPSGSPPRRSPFQSSSRRSHSGSPLRRSPSGSPGLQGSPRISLSNSPARRSGSTGRSPTGSLSRSPSGSRQSDHGSYSRRTHLKKSKRRSDEDGQLSDGSDGRSNISSSSSFGEGQKGRSQIENGEQEGRNKKFHPHNAEDLSDVSDLESAAGDGSLDSVSDEEGDKKIRSKRSSDGGKEEERKASPIRMPPISSRKDIVSQSDEMEQLDFEAEEPQGKEDREEGECGDAVRRPASSINDTKSEGDDGELKGEEIEEGEITDEDENRPEETEPRPICRFYNRGQCTWGSSCRFLHPGVTDKGNYTMFDMVRPLVPANGPPMYGPIMDFRAPIERPVMASMGPVYSSRKEEPPVESAWERGLRTAKEMMRKASKRKETDMDFDEKKMNLSLGQDELDKENDYYTRPASPLDDERWSDKEGPEGKHHRVVVADRYDSMDPYYPHPREGSERWRAGHYEADMRLEYGREHMGYDRRHPGPHHSHPHMAYRAHMHPSAHHDPSYYPDKYERKKKSHTVREVIVQHSRKPWKEESRPGSDARRGRGDEWADPWMRSKSPTSRKTRTRRQSYSSGSSYSSSSSSRSSRSYSSSYTRSPSRSRSRSRSKSRSLSISRSRSHTPPAQSIRRPGRSGPRASSPPQPRQRRPAGDPRVRGSRAVSPALLSEKRAATERAVHMNPPAPSPRKQRPPSPGATRKAAQNPPPPAGRAGRTLDRKAVGGKVRQSKSSRSSSSDSSGSSSDSSETSLSSSSSSRDNTPPPKQKKIVIDERLLAQTNKGKAMDALKLSGQKQQIKLTLKAPGSIATAASDDPRRSTSIAGKKRPAESPPPEAAKAGAAPKPAAKKTTSRREELLKQLKAVEDAIARKRSKIA